MQFVETADKIEAKAMDVCRKWPKSFTFIITNRTVELASAIYEHVMNANSIFPIKTEDERTERILELQRALGATLNFARKIERAYKLFPICGEKKNESHAALEGRSNRLLEEFMQLCAEEEEAVKGNIRFTRSFKIT